MEIIFKKVPNYKKASITPLAVCFHIGEANQDIIYQTFLTEEKSSHYIIGEKGIWQCVPESYQAWAQGNVIRPTHILVLNNPDKNPNEYLLSIENSGFGNVDIPEWQYWKNAELYENICLRYNWPVDREHCLRHREINADKTCPGKIDLDKIVRYAQQIRKEKEAPVIIPAVVTIPEKIEVIKKKLSIMERLVALLIRLNILKSMNDNTLGSTKGRKYGAFSSSVNPERLALTIKGLAVFIPSVVALASLWNVDINSDELTDILLTASLAISQAGTAVGTGMALWGLVRKILVKLQIL